MSRTDVLGVCFDNADIIEFTDTAFRLIDEPGTSYVVTPNTEMVLEAQKNKVLMKAIKNASLVIPDGIGVIYASHILGTPLKCKVAGIDFASALMARLSIAHKKVFLLGAAPGVAETAANNLEQRFPGLIISGTHDGFFTEDKNDAVITLINDASPDFLMVCLGFPEQEIWMMDNADKLNVGLMAGLGGSLDIYSGLKQRAPDKWIKLGLEWLYRLIKEPYRIERMVKLPLILFKAIFKRIGG